MLCGDLDEDPNVASDIEQRSTIGRSGQFLKRLQVMLKGEDSALPLLQVERIPDRLIRIHDVVVVEARTYVDEAASPAFDDRVVLAVPAVGAGIGGPVARVGGLPDRAGVSYRALVCAAQVAAHVLHQTCFPVSRPLATLSTVPIAFLTSFFEILDAPRRRFSKMMGTSPTR